MSKRALVLGGGGPVGIAWEAGLVAGLEEGGVRLCEAEVIVGTSAGSVVGAQIASGSTGADLANTQRQQSARGGDVNSRGGDVNRSNTSGKPAQAAPDLTELMQLFARRPGGDEAAQVPWRVEVGAYALAARTIAPEAFIGSFGRMATGGWPARDYRCTAIDAETGAFKVWTREDNVILGAAVASSCAVPGIYPCIPIAGRRWYDGGLRSGTNADIAQGCDSVVVVSVLPGSALAAPGARNPLDDELALLRDAGAQVQLIASDDDSRVAFGPNLMDARRREAALEAGIRQGRALAAQWRLDW